MSRARNMRDQPGTHAQAAAVLANEGRVGESVVRSTMGDAPFNGWLFILTDRGALLFVPPTPADSRGLDLSNLPPVPQA